MWRASFVAVLLVAALLSPTVASGSCPVPRKQGVRFELWQMPGCSSCHTPRGVHDRTPHRRFARPAHGWKLARPIDSF